MLNSMHRQVRSIILVCISGKEISLLRKHIERPGSIRHCQTDTTGLPVCVLRSLCVAVHKYVTVSSFSTVSAYLGQSALCSDKVAATVTSTKQLCCRVTQCTKRSASLLVRLCLIYQGRARPSIASLYNWRYGGLRDLPGVTEVSSNMLCSSPCMYNKHCPGASTSVML